MVFKGTLRTKFIFSLALISALLTWATLEVVRHRVEMRVREEIAEGLRNSVVTFRSLERQRGSMLERSAALLAALPPLKAVMTTRHPATIQDASATFWELSGSQMFVIADAGGTLMALHASGPGFDRDAAQAAMAESLRHSRSRDWWYGRQRLFEVFLQPIYFGSPADNAPMGTLAVGYEIDSGVAADISRVAASQVAFRHRNEIVVSTIPASQNPGLAVSLDRLAISEGQPADLQLGRERYLATAVRLSAADATPVTLTVLKSYDEATAFLHNLNRWIVAAGAAAVLLGSLLVFFVSTTFTKPLAELVSGVRALEKGDFAYPLQAKGNDEVSDLTAAFQRMRVRLQDTQKKLLDSERLATIGRMASTISHDLRHPLTAILAYAEFLSNGNLSDEKRKDFFEEIRIAVSRMTDEISSLVGFSKQREALRPAYGKVEEVIDRAIQTVKVLPEHRSIAIVHASSGECAGWFDHGKLERVLLNLLFNACEAVPRESGRIEVTSGVAGPNIEIRVADNGPGIPDEIRESLFQPFVSQGKEKGTGLGLTVVQKIMQDHGGSVAVQQTGPAGTVFLLTLPRRNSAHP